MSEHPTRRDLSFAVRYLTLAPIGTAGALGPSTLFFPLVGVAVGMAATAVDALAAAFPDLLRAAVAALFLAVATRARGLRGLAHVGAAVAAGADRARALEVMQAPRASAAGYVVAGVAFAAKLWALFRPGPLRPWALLFAPMLGCWAMVVVAHNARLARVGAPGPRFEPGITFREFGWASVVAVGLALALLEAVGLVVALGAAVVAVVLRLLWHRWLGGLNEPTLHTTREAAEVAVLALFTLFASR